MMKKTRKILASLLTVVMMGAIFTGCSSNGKDEKNVPTKDIVATIKEKIETAPTGPVDDELAKEKFHLNLEDIEEYTIENGMRNTGLETLAVVKAKDGKVESVKASLEKAIEEKRAAAFYPGEPEAVDAAQFKAIGNYIGLFIIPDYEEGSKNSEKAMAIFEESLK